MASGKEDVYQTVWDSLKEKGIIHQLQSKTRVEVLRVLKDEDGSQKQDEPPSDNFIINELIKDYLEWNNLPNAKDVLCLESGHSKTSVSREELEKSLGIECGPNSRKVPLLYAIVSDLKKKQKWCQFCPISFKKFPAPLMLLRPNNQTHVFCCLQRTLHGAQKLVSWVSRGH